MSEPFFKPGKRISFSSYKTYQECAYKWFLEKVERLSPIEQPAFFVFGSAVDLALNCLLLDEGDPYEELDKELERIFQSPVVFDPRDYDGEIITGGYKEKALKQCQDIGYKGDDLDVMVKKLFALYERTDGQSKALAIACHASLRAKGYLMIDTYARQIMPMFDEVESVQEYVDHGIMDFRAKIRGHGSLVGDNKTAARAYEQDAVKHSIQMAGYGAEKAMYIVLDKTIRKNRVKVCSKCHKVEAGRNKTCAVQIDGTRCHGEFNETIRPEVSYQLLIDDIPETTRVLVKGAYRGTENVIDASLKSVKEGAKPDEAFPRNLSACRMRYGPKLVTCPFYKKCWENSEEGLTKREERK